MYTCGSALFYYTYISVKLEQLESNRSIPSVMLSTVNMPLLKNFRIKNAQPSQERFKNQVFCLYKALGRINWSIESKKKANATQ